jgi:hypothetical protein
MDLLDDLNVGRDDFLIDDYDLPDLPRFSDDHVEKRAVMREEVEKMYVINAEAISLIQGLSITLQRRVTKALLPRLLKTQKKYQCLLYRLPRLGLCRERKRQVARWIEGIFLQSKSDRFERRSHRGSMAGVVATCFGGKRGRSKEAGFSNFSGRK